MIDEVKQYLWMLDDLRDQVVAMIEGASADLLNWRPEEQAGGEGYNSLAVLAAHIAGVELRWSVEVIGGIQTDRDRDSEFETVAEEPDELIQNLRRVGEKSREVLGSLSAEDLSAARMVEGHNTSMRWAILHMIEHAALHLGHMQITYQLYEQGKTKYMPRWFERIPPA